MTRFTAQNSTPWEGGGVSPSLQPDRTVLEWGCKAVTAIHFHVMPVYCARPSIYKPRLGFLLLWLAGHRELYMSHRCRLRERRQIVGIRPI